MHMQVYNSNTVLAGVYLCTKVKLGKFESSGSQAGGCEGGRFVVWGGLGVLAI